MTKIKDAVMGGVMIIIVSLGRWLGMREEDE